jgi:hypothetical protein
MLAPSVSVLYPLRNASQYPNFERGLQSTLDQEGVDVEVVIGVDPNCTDDTWGMISDWAARDSRIKPFLRDPSFIFGETLDACAARANGDYFIIQTARVWYTSGTLATFATDLHNFAQQAWRFPDHDPIGFICGATAQKNPRGEWYITTNTSRIRDSKREYYDRFFSLLGYMYRAEMWRDYGCRYAIAEYADDGSWIGMGDRDFQMQIVMQGCAGYQRDILSMYYDGPGELTRKLQANRAAADKFWRDRWGDILGMWDE